MTLNPPKARIKLIATIAILPLALWHGSAQAQTQAEPVLQGDGPDREEDGDHFRFGVGGAYMPVYQGADKYRFQPLPVIDVKWGRYFINFQDGIGANAIDTETVTVGAGFVLADGYRAKDAPQGIGKLSMGLGARGFVTLRQAGFEATIGGTKILTGSTEGFIADASLSYPIMVDEKLMLVPSVGTTWADEKHNNRYFGVNAQQSLASGLPQFSVGNGFVDAKAELGAMYRLTDRIGLGATAGVTTLFGDVKDSPIVEKKTQPFGIFYVSYSF